jgi:superfamily II DNA/RNA helicase/cold shock CspA family protein
MSTSFADLGVPAEFVSTLRARGIDAPFAIQTLTLADGLAGRDLCGRAPTGSGKTLAFGIPMAARVSTAKPGRPTGLVLVPTRELAAQVTRELEWLGRPRRLKVAAVYGGTGFGAQLKALRRGVDVLVACPGRLIDLMGRREVSLDRVEIVVLDEADRMADMGFLPVVRRLLDEMPVDRQTLLFSATLDGVVDTLVRDYQRDPVRHALPVDPDAVSLATHHFWAVDRDDRLTRCLEVIEHAGPTIVFCRTKHGTEALAKKLHQRGVRCEAIHGNRSQGQRERALEQFASGRVDALIATDVAARGIHVDDVGCVLHFDLPADEKDYAHRSGRTARAGASGNIVSFVPRDQRRDAAKFQRLLGLPSGLTAPDASVLARDAVPAERVSSPERGRIPASVAAVASAPSVDDAVEFEPLPADAPQGTIKWYDTRRGFGFIARGDADDVFVHGTSFEGVSPKRLREGQRVEFVLRPGRKGEEAARVRVLAS